MAYYSLSSAKCMHYFFVILSHKWYCLLHLLQELTVSLVIEIYEVARREGGEGEEYY